MEDNIINDFDGEAAYEAYLDQLDAPRWYLEKTYPTFYKYFKQKYEEFIETWIKEAGMEKLSVDIKDEMFVDLCTKINYEIEAEHIFKDSLNYIEKKGWPKPEPGKISLITNAADQLIEAVIGIPMLVMETFINKGDIVKKKLDEWETKYGKYPKGIFRKAYELQEDAKKKRMKLTAENAIVKANEEGEYYEKQELINEFEQGTILLFNLKRTYDNYWKKKIKEEKEEK